MIWFEDYDIGFNPHAIAYIGCENEEDAEDGLPYLIVIELITGVEHEIGFSDIHYRDATYEVVQEMMEEAL